MIPLYYIIQINYPGVTIGLNQQVELVNHNDGEGDQIAIWSVPNVLQPTTSQLAALQTDTNTINNYQLILNIEANKPVMMQLEDIDKRSIRSIRENDTAMIAQWSSQAAILRAKLLPTTLAALAATQPGSNS